MIRPVPVGMLLVMVVATVTMYWGNPVSIAFNIAILLAAAMAGFYARRFIDGR